MFSNHWIGPVLRNRIAPMNRAHKRVGQRERKKFSRRPHLRVEQLETRVTPSVNPATPFELDGNVTTQSATTHDWDQVFADNNVEPPPFSGALASSFVTDKVNTTADDIFQGGGSKDTLGLQSGQWLFTGSKPQGKNDITHAYAAAYIDPSSGHLILYAGLDRFDNSGDATAGFWFFQNPIGENPNVTTNGGHPFTGTHADGDILLVSDFTIGGSVSTVKVFRWTGNDSTGSLVALNNGNPINGDTFAIVNSGPISVPWSYTNKSGANQPAAGEFLEEGVDLTALGISGCFSTFLAETRSSQSPTATLSDFALGSFPLCSIATVPFDSVSKVGDDVAYTLQVQNTGAIKLFPKNVTDTLLGNLILNGVVQSPVSPVKSIAVTGLSGDGSLAPEAVLTVTVIRTVQVGDPDPTNDTTTFIFNENADFSGSVIMESVDNGVNLFQPSATMTETASPTAGVVGTPITYTFTINNTSSSDSPNLVLGSGTSFFTDTLFPNIEADAIAAMPIHPGDGTGQVAPGGSFTFTETRSIMPGDATPLTDIAAAGFTLTQNLGAFSNVIHASASTTTHTVDARISIAPDATNEVGQPHTFTVTVLQDDGLPIGAPGGDAYNGFGAAVGASVTASLTNTNGAVATQFDGVPLVLSGTTDASGHFQVEFTSATAGQVIGNATATLSVSGVSITRATGDGISGDGNAATKTFVNANVTIMPNATNGITEPHTFTVTVMQDDGLTAAQGGDGVTGFTAASGANVAVTLTNQNGAVAMPSTPLSGMTDGSGHFAVTFTSDSAGQVIGNATANLTVLGVALTRATGDSHTGDSGPATKTFVAGKILWKKVDEAGNLLGGATFLVTATGGTAASAGHTPLSVSVLDNGPFDANPTPGLLELDAFQMFGGSALTGLALGTYTVQETIPPPTYTLDPKILTATLTLSSLTADLTGSPFVDTLPHLVITKTVTSDGTSAVIHPGDTASFTITVSNTGLGTASGIVVTDQLPEAGLLSWSVASSGFDTASLSAGDFLTASRATLLGGGSVSVTVSALIPSGIFGPPAGQLGNGDPLPSGIFELDGNAFDDPSVSGQDWDSALGLNASIPSTATQTSFVTDAFNTTKDDIFQAGGSKDTLGIQQGQWLFTASKPQAKDDITHAYTALYQAPPIGTQTVGDEILFAGLDRFDNSGDATAGFWFFQNAIGQDSSVTIGGGHPFTGTHTDGDILLVSDFTIGGSVSTVKVFRWTGNDSTGSLVAVPTPPNTTFAIVNGGNITLPWSFINKSKTPGNVALPGEFLEEGVNLTALGLSSCFSTFLAETRSSQSPTATLSDFVLGNFNTCMLTLPNTAHLHADNPPVDVDSNQVLITVVEGGMPMLAGSIGSGSGMAGLTDQQLQAAMAQAIAQWRAAGVDGQRLAALENQVVQVADLSHGELGWTLANHSWIDRTAEGWGWSVDGAPVQGKMDLLTVVTHELGHVLDMPYTDSGVMELNLTPGTRMLPEASRAEGATGPTSNTIVAVSQTTAAIEQGVRGAEGLGGLMRESSLSTRLSPTLSFEQKGAAVLGVAPGQIGPIIVNRQPALSAAVTSAPVDVSSRDTGNVPSPAKRPENGAGYNGWFDDDPQETTDWIDLPGGSTSDWGAGQASPGAPAGEDAGAGWLLTRDSSFAQENWDRLVLGRTEALQGAWEDGAFVDAALTPMLGTGLAMALGGGFGADPERVRARKRGRFQV